MKAPPLIITLSKEERRAMIKEIAQSPQSYLNITIDALNFIDNMIDELRSAKINISVLQKMFGFKSEKLKKLFQAR